MEITAGSLTIGYAFTHAIHARELGIAICSSQEPNKNKKKPNQRKKKKRDGAIEEKQREVGGK